MPLYKVLVNIPVTLYVTSESRTPSEVGESIDANIQLIQEEIANNYELSEIETSIAKQLDKGKFTVSGPIRLSTVE